MNNVFGPTFPPNLFAQVSASGSFSSSQTQPQSSANTPTAITYTTHETSDGITFDPVHTSRILVPRDGLYELNFSIQMDQDTGSTHVADIWLRINGVDVDRSASQVTVSGQNAETFLFANFFLQLASTDYVEIVYASSELTLCPTAFPQWTTPTNPYNRPAVPSIITTVKLLTT